MAITKSRSCELDWSISKFWALSQITTFQHVTTKHMSPLSIGKTSDMPQKQYMDEYDTEHGIV